MSELKTTTITIMVLTLGMLASWAYEPGKSSAPVSIAASAAPEPVAKPEVPVKTPPNSDLADAVLSLSASLAALDQRLVGMEASGARLGERLDGFEQDLGVLLYGNSGDTEFIGGPEPDEAELAAASRRVAQAREDVLDAQLATEAPDAPYSDTIAAELRASFAEPALAGARLAAVDCRTTVCEVEFETAQGGSSSDAIDSVRDVLLAAADGPVEGFYRTRHLPGGGEVTRLFVSRAGTSLPESSRL